MPGLGHGSSPRFFALPAGLLGALALLVAAPAGAAQGPPAGAPTGGQAAPLSPRLVVLSSPGVRSLGAARQARRVGLTPSGAGSLLRHGRRVLVDVRFAGGAAAGAEALRQAGAGIVAVSPRYQTVTVAALPSQLREVAAVPGVEGVREELAPFTAAACPQGSVVSAGDRQLEAARARADFGVDGSGVTVGILSDSFNQWSAAPASEASDVATGDLPGPGNPCGFERPVKVLTPLLPEDPEEEEEAEDEGRAMAQIVHDVAPGADIDFTSAFNGEFAFAEGIRELHDEGADVIADDVAYFNEPFFQDGPIADAVDEVVAAGASYFSAAGNDNLKNAAGQNIGSIEAPAFRPMGCPPALPSYYETCMDFDPAPGAEDDTWGVDLEEESPLYVDLQWAQPWNGVTTDLDMFLLNEEGKLVGRALNLPNVEPGVQEPFEFSPYEGGISGGKQVEGIQVVIARCDEACGEGRAKEVIEGEKPYAGKVGGDDGTPRLKVAIFNNGGGVLESEYPESSGGDVVGPTIFGHTAAAGAISVAAISVGTMEAPEEYSSRGPVVHLFGPVTGTEAAPPIAAETIDKPNLTASDCGLTTFFYGYEDGGFHFCGTSAAAPHAAGVAALIRSANPAVSNAEVRADLEATARPVGNSFGLYPPSAVGAGLLDAESAVAALALPPTVTITGPPAATSTERSPAIAFVADRRASFACSLDGGPAAPCTSPYVPPAPLAAGGHEFEVTATDASGRTGSATVGFAIEAQEPAPAPAPSPSPVPAQPSAPTSTQVSPPAGRVLPIARFAVRPRAVVRTRKRSARVRFELVANVPNATFRCRVDKLAFRPCRANFARTLRPGRHEIAAVAVDAAGDVGKPVTVTVRVRRVAPRRGRHHGRHRTDRHRGS